MRCSFCGSPLPGGARFCPACGTSAFEPRPRSARVSTKPDPVEPRDWASAPPPGIYTSTAAVVSLIFGIAAWSFLPLIGAIIAVIAGHMAQDEIRNSFGRIQGSGLATVGLILGYIQVVPLLIALIVGVVLLAIAVISHLGFVIT